MSRVFLIRHGQASWGKKNYDVLSEVGIAQSTVLGNHLQSWQLNPSRIICGEHERHQNTAKHCLRALHIEPQFEINPLWNEFDFQDVINQHKPLYRVHELMVADLARTLTPRKNFKEMFDQALQLWRSGEHDDKYTESWPAFQQRVLQALTQLSQIKTEGDVLIFTSGGVIGTIVCHLLNTDEQQWMPTVASIINTSVTQLEIKNEKLQLCSFNVHSHFMGKHQSLLSQH